MRPFILLKNLAFLLLVLYCTASVFAQGAQSSDVTMVEVVEDPTPASVQALPDYPNVRGTHIMNNADLKRSLGERPVLDLVDFRAGTTAATANYDAGKLLIVEYMTPQASVDADNNFRQRLAEQGVNASVAYRRVGNYSVFVFDGSDAAAANALIDQVKYEKSVQWLGADPFFAEKLRRAERAYIATTSDIFISTVIAIALGILTTIVFGIAVGVIFFRIRRRQRDEMTAFSDAGGMVRLNLDELTPDVAPTRLLNQ